MDGLFESALAFASENAMFLMIMVFMVYRLTKASEPIPE